ncbi:MAG: hypothetical protein M1832_005214 [Thelocarpon impressellum]|nr:MAG: hypothetical protein M1832_005214 [Thelocarpon impressellum]
MNGRNSHGRAVSLLNDEPGRGSVRSPTTSHGSTVSRDSSVSQYLPSHVRPPTPELMRSGSWSSQRTNESPSPKTPAFIYEARPAGAAVSAPSSYGHVTSSSSSQRLHKGANGRPGPAESRSASAACPPPVKLQSAVGRADEGAPTPPPPLSPTVSAKPVTKNFPCQLAAEYGCEETFTTSGHASRHAKKHTGEKKVACPKCPKRFARKDNMKQHLKTHENGRGADRLAGIAEAEAAGSSRAGRAQKPRPKSGKRAGSPLPRLQTDLMQRKMSDEDMPGSAASAGYGSPQTPRHRASPGSHHLPLDDIVSQCPPSALTPGLDALVLAADAKSRR